MTGLPVPRDVPCGSRVSDRHRTKETATLTRGGTAFTVTIIDMGLEGFGIFSKRRLKTGEEIKLDVSADGGFDSYICKVAFCLEDGDGFHIGMNIVDSEEEVILIDEIILDQQ